MKTIKITETAVLVGKKHQNLEMNLVSCIFILNDVQSDYPWYMIFRSAKILRPKLTLLNSDCMQNTITND